MRDAREDPKTQAVAVRRNPTKTSTAWCVGVRYTNVNQSRLAEVMTDDAYYKAKKNLIKGVDKTPNLCYNNNVNKTRVATYRKKGNDTMTNTKKMTKADYFNQILANYALTEDEKAFVEHELELLAKKNSADKKPTAQQVANAGICDAIYDAMEDGKLYTITDLIKTVPECAELTNQRVSAIVRGMIGTKVDRVEEKRKAYFRKIAE